MENEQRALERIAERLDLLYAFVQQTPAPARDDADVDWFRYLSELKGILGNFHQWLSLVSCLMAKRYLYQHFSMAPFDVALKPQGAPGLDIDAWTLTGDRVIGEIKTTVPYLGTRLGAQQKKSIALDIDKLVTAQATNKFLFVTHQATADAIQIAFGARLDQILIICLIDSENSEGNTFR